MAINIVNNTGSDVEVLDLGISVPASGSRALDYNDLLLLYSSTNIKTLVTAGTLTVNITSDDNAKYLPFDNSTNGYNSENVQDAIEESRISGIGTVIPFNFSSSGNVADKWLEFISSSAPSNDVPLIAPQAMELKGLTFSNNDDNVDIDVEVYLNATLLYTWNIRNKRTAFTTGISGGSISKGDRLSVFMRKFDGGTGDNTSQTPVISLLLKIVTETASDGGTQNGV